jgi:hypothetical protein
VYLSYPPWAFSDAGTNIDFSIKFVYSRSLFDMIAFSS